MFVEHAASDLEHLDYVERQFFAQWFDGFDSEMKDGFDSETTDGFDSESTDVLLVVGQAVSGYRLGFGLLDRSADLAVVELEADWEQRSQQEECLSEKQ